MLDCFSYWHLTNPERHLLHAGGIKGGNSSPIDAKVLSHANSSSRYLMSHTINSIWSLFKLGVVTNTTIKSLPLICVGVVSLLDGENAKSIFSKDPNVVCEKCYENTRTLTGTLFDDMTVYKFALSFLAPLTSYRDLYRELTHVPHPTTPFFSSVGELMGSAVTRVADLATATFNLGPEDICAIDSSSVLSSKIFNLLTPFYTQNIPYRAYINAAVTSFFLNRNLPSFIAQQTAFFTAERGSYLWHILETQSSLGWLALKISLASKLYPLAITLGANPISVIFSDPKIVCPTMRSNVLNLISTPIQRAVGNLIFDPFRSFRVLFERKNDHDWGISSAISSVTDPILSSIGNGLFFLADTVSYPLGGRIKATCLLNSETSLGGRVVNFMGSYVRNYKSLSPYFHYQKYFDAIVTTHVLYKFILTQYNYFFDKEAELAVNYLKKNFAEMTTTLKELSNQTIKTKDDRFKGLNLKRTADKIVRSKKTIIEELDQLGLEQLDEETMNQLVDPLIQVARAITKISPA